MKSFRRTKHALSAWNTLFCLLQGMPGFVRLDPSDATFVDVIHTDVKSIIMGGKQTHTIFFDFLFCGPTNYRHKILLFVFRKLKWKTMISDMLNCLSTYMKKSDSRAEGRRKKRPTKLTIFFLKEKKMQIVLKWKNMYFDEKFCEIYSFGSICFIKIYINWNHLQGRTLP